MTASGNVYPRLDSAAADELIRNHASLEIEAIAALAATSHPRVSWYETATSRVSENQLRELRLVILDIARDEGYPVPTPRRYAGFDQRVSPELLRRMNILPADASHPGVWMFISLVLLPDVAVWRWAADRHRDRFTGRQHRDTFRRLWSRAYAVGEHAAAQLLEDEFTGIMERTSIAGDPRVAKAVAAAHLSAVAEELPVSRTDLLREAMKRIRRMSVVVHFPALDGAQLQRLLEEVYRDTLEAIGSRAQSS
ncbi:hypothetical protein AB0D32_12705 [Micromonospora sp. NPDC048170]|uniref:hypothetical protein n=1 Tax=Micromonospora sp. NPDC048170 TaxID=3154819 RepID=UPI0033CEADA6